MAFTFNVNDYLFRFSSNFQHATIILWLETFMEGVQRTGAGSKQRIPRVVSKPDSNHGSATTANRNLGLTPAGTICRSNLSLNYYPIHSSR